MVSGQVKVKISKDFLQELGIGGLKTCLFLTSCSSIWLSVALMESMTLWTSMFRWPSSSLQNRHVELILCRNRKSRGLTENRFAASASDATRLLESPEGRFKMRRLRNTTSATIPRCLQCLQLLLLCCIV